MSKSYKIRRKVIELGHSKAVTLPGDWKGSKAESIDLEIFEDKIIITPAN